MGKGINSRKAHLEARLTRFALYSLMLKFCNAGVGEEDQRARGSDPCFGAGLEGKNTGNEGLQIAHNCLAEATLSDQTSYATRGEGGSGAHALFVDI